MIIRGLGLLCPFSPSRFCFFSRFYEKNDGMVLWGLKLLCALPLT